MFRHKETGIIFQNRRQAIKLMGQSRYNRSLKNQEFEWDVENSLKVKEEDIFDKKNEQSNL